jgi:Ca-activated chloride channel homolog
MTVPITPMSDDEGARVAAPAEEAGLGALRTERGNLPLDRIDVRAAAQ